MIHSELRVFRAAGNANNIGAIDSAIRQHGGAIINTGGIAGQPWVTTYAAERSLEPEINAAIGGKPGERVS